MQGSGVEIKKRKLSLKNVKTNKNGYVENIDVHFKSSLPVPKSDLIKIDTVDLTGEDVHEKLSDKSQEDADVSIITNAGLLKIRALIEQFRDEIPQPLCPLPAYKGPPRVTTTATTRATETTPTHLSPLPHLCLSTLRMRNLISAARQDMMETAAQCVNVTSDKDTRTSRHSDVTELSSKDTNTSLPGHWCIDKLPISDTNTSVNETAGFSKYVIPDSVNHRTTHPVTNKAASVHTFTPYRADVTKPSTSQIGESHSYKMMGTNYPKADKPFTVNRNSQKLCEEGDIQEALVRTNIHTTVRTHTSNKTLKRPAEKRTRDPAEECSGNFGGASKSCADSAGGTQEDLLTNCPLCSEEFPRGMDQMAIDHHIAQCVAAADEETTW